MALQHLRSSTANKRPTPDSMSDGQLALNTNVASPGVFFKDSTGALVKAGPVHVGSTAPNASPAVGGQSGNSTGELWLDTSLTPNELKTWNGSAWVSATGQEIPVSKLIDGSARQLLQTDAAGTGVEWTSNVDVPGTLDVTSTATFDSIASHPLGSAGAPTITFTGDTNTGIYSPGADQVAISTGGTGRLFVDASGNVGVGAASPGYLLDIAGDMRLGTSGGSGNGIYFTRSGQSDAARVACDSSSNLQFWTATSERLRITSDGKLGLGTSAPSGSGGSKLNVAKQTLTTSDMGLASFELASNSSRWPQVFLEKSRGSAVGQKTLVLNGDSLGEIAFTGADGANFIIGAAIVATVNGTAATNDMPTQLEFRTQEAGGAASPSTRMVIDPTGRVGVGTTSPIGLMHLKGDTNNNGAELILGVDNNNTTDNLGAVLFGNNVNSTLSKILSGTSGNNTSSYLTFSTSASGAQSEAMRIDSSGRLLVGTSSALGNYHQFNALSTASNHLAIVGVHNATNDDVRGIYSYAPNCTTADGFLYLGAVGADVIKFAVRTDGDVQNVNNSYGAYSDVRLKENIVDAASQWDDIKNLQVRKYNFKENTGHATHTQIGLIAQEVELVSPGLVGESQAEPLGDSAETMKTINYSVLYMKAVKALQEAMERIETLEAKVAALETP